MRLGVVSCSSECRCFERGISGGEALCWKLGDYMYAIILGTCSSEAGGAWANFFSSPFEMSFGSATRFFTIFNLLFGMVGSYGEPSRYGEGGSWIMGVFSFACFSSGVLMPPLLPLLPLLMLLAAPIILWMASLERLFCTGFWLSAGASTGSSRLKG